MEINKTTLSPFLLFNEEIRYNDYITLYPVKMKHIIEFQSYQSALMLRKDSIFHEKHLIKMEYWDFIKYAYQNKELEKKYHIPFLSYYYEFIIRLFQMACGKPAKIECNPQNLNFSINGFPVTNPVFEDLRKIIIIQNDIDFDVDEFMNIDTLRALEKAQEFELKKKKEKSDIEDYIDSLIIALKVPEEYVSDLTIRKFWRYIKRINMHDEYQACRSGQMSGMVTFKEPLQHWMTGIKVTDKYEHLKSNEDELRSKIE